jgi:hypothetical protein
MLKRYLACSGFAVALLFVMVASARAGEGCQAGGQSVGIPAGVSASYAEADPADSTGYGDDSATSAEPGPARDGSVVAPPAPNESIGTGTMAGDDANSGISLFGGKNWDAILGIDNRPDYNGPWRPGSNE